MILQDDRTPEQHKTHYVLWGGTDRFLSGWGLAGNGPSYAFWACVPEDSRECERTIRQRSHIQRVREVTRHYRPRGSGHCHIYVYKGATNGMP